MSITVRIPTPLRSATGGAATVEVEGKTVRDIVDALESQHPGIKERICEPERTRLWMTERAFRSSPRLLAADTRSDTKKTNHAQMLDS
jgi:molybdopterin converting factor small subunit